MADEDAVIDVLLIEDDRDTLEMYRTKLELDGYRVHVAFDGVEGLERAKELLPDIVFLDVRLPKKDGFEVLREVKNLPDVSCVPVVILTSSQAERDILKSYNLRANCFISKPVDVDEFLNTVRSTGEFWLSIVKLPLGERSVSGSGVPPALFAMDAGSADQEIL